jgi:hypothetical protein
VIFQLTVVCCIASAIAMIIGFLLYVKARMADRTEDPRLDETQQAQRLARLDRDERRYQTLYFIMGFLFFALGILILIQLSIRVSGPFGHHPLAGHPRLRMNEHTSRVFTPLTTIK